MREIDILQNDLRLTWSTSCQIIGYRWRACQQYDVEYELNKGNNKITELRTILQRESQNS
jgi:hypothetical protein